MISPLLFTDYELIDHGEIRKLERFGSIVCNRPEPSATWNRESSKSNWNKAELVFNEQENQKGFWNKNAHQYQDWTIEYDLFGQQIKLELRPSTSKHIGVFPEQAVNWNFIYQQCLRIGSKVQNPRVLNLFAYTGAASLAASLGGASVTHVDSSASVVQWAKRNAELNDISNIRWIVEDARKFVAKCIRREELFQGIILDPPIFGLAKKGEAWKLNKDLQNLIEDLMKIIDPKQNFFVLNTYSPQLPMEKLADTLSKTDSFPNQFEQHILGLETANSKKLPLGNLIRFSK